MVYYCFVTFTCIFYSGLAYNVCGIVWSLVYNDNDAAATTTRYYTSPITIIIIISFICEPFKTGLYSID